jgi:hypothetical protein
LRELLESVRRRRFDLLLCDQERKSDPLEDFLVDVEGVSQTIALTISHPYRYTKAGGG